MLVIKYNSDLTIFRDAQRRLRRRRVIEETGDEASAQSMFIAFRGDDITKLRRALMTDITFPRQAADVGDDDDAVCLY